MTQALTLAAEHSEGSKFVVGLVAIVVVVASAWWLVNKLFK